MRTVSRGLMCVVWVALGCGPSTPGTGVDTETGGDGDGDAATSGDGDGDAGDGDGDAGDGDGDLGDGDGDLGDGDGDLGDGDGDLGDGDGDPGDGDGDEAPPPVTFECFEEGSLPWDGPLCGGAEPACEIEAFGVIVPDIYAFRPILVASPGCQLHFSIKHAQDYAGSYGHNTGEGWTFEPLEDLNPQGLAVDHISGEPYVFGDSGKTYRRSEGAWTLVNGIDAVTHMFGHTGPDGSVHMAYGNDTDIHYARLVGDAWEELQHHGSKFDDLISPVASLFGHLQYVTSWDAEITWQAHDAPYEAVAQPPEGYAVMGAPRWGINGIDPEQPQGVAHVAAVYERADEQVQLSHLWRRGPDDWVGTVVDTGTPSQIEPDVDLIHEDRIEPRMMQVVLAADAARVLWVRSHWLFTRELICDPDCEWVTIEDNSSHTLMIGQSVEGEFLSQAVSEVPDLYQHPAVAVDELGRIHVVLNVNDPEASLGHSLHHMILASP